MSRKKSGAYPTPAWPTLLTYAPQSLEPAGCAGEVTEEDWTGCSQKVKQDKELLEERVQGWRLLSPMPLTLPSLFLPPCLQLQSPEEQILQ